MRDSLVFVKPVLSPTQFILKKYGKIEDKDSTIDRDDPLFSKVRKSYFDLAKDPHSPHCSLFKENLPSISSPRELPSEKQFSGLKPITPQQIAMIRLSQRKKPREITTDNLSSVSSLSAI